MRNNRVYRFLRASLTIALAALRYLVLMTRERVPGLRPSQAAWDRAHARTGRAIYLLATRLGGAFVKLGQILGARADALPEPLVSRLRPLHDQVPARPLERLRPHVERALGRPLERVFAEVEEEPLAAASLAQVHRARLEGGDRVVVKIQYPEARSLFPVDLASLRRAARVVRLLNRRLDLRPLADELAEFVCLELDFDREADSTARIARAFAADPRVRIPEVYRDLSSERLLVLEYLEGERVTDVDRLRELGVDLRDLAERIVGVYCAMIFDHGFFQGDPHPGNFLHLEGGAIGLLDFGLTKELPPGFAGGMARLLGRTIAGDAEGAIAAARSIGFEVGGDDASDLLALVRMLIGHEQGSRRLRDLLESRSLEAVPSHFALIVRVFVLLAGLSHRLAPGQGLLKAGVARALAPHLAAGAA